MGLVYSWIQKRIGRIHLTFIYWLAGLGLVCTDLHGQAEAILPSEVQFAGVPIHLTAQTRRLIQQQLQHLYPTPKATQMEASSLRQLTSQIKPLLQQAGLPDDFCLLALPFADTDSLGLWALSAMQAKKLNLRVNAQVDERYHSLISTEAVLTLLRDWQKKNRNYAITLIHYLEWAMQANVRQSAGLTYVQPDPQSPPILWKILARKVAMMHPPFPYHPAADSISYTYRTGKGRTLQAIAQQLLIPVEKLKSHNQWLKTEVIPADKEYSLLLELTPDEYLRVETLAEPEPGTKLPPTTGFPLLVKVEKRTDPVRASAQYYQINQRRGVQAQNCDNIITLAFYGDVTINAFLKFNDLTDPQTLIQPGQVYYLQLKARRANIPFHVVQKNQSLLDISNLYGVRLKSLLKFNRLPKTQRLLAGRVLWLQSKRPAKQPVAYVQPQPEPTPDQATSPRQELIETPVKTAPTPVIANRLVRPFADTLLANQTPPERKALPKKAKLPSDTSVMTKSRQLIWHVVEAGQTYYSISRLYDVAVNLLYVWNRLSERIPLRVGQSLLVMKEKSDKAIRPPVSVSPLRQPVPTNSLDRSPVVRKANFYTVQAGQTLHHIALLNKVRVQDLVLWNNLKNTAIEVGQILVIWR